MSKHQRKHSPEAKRDVIRLRDAKLSYPQIAAATGICISVCHRIYEADRRDCLLAMDGADLRDAGLSISEIEKKLGTSVRHIKFVMADRSIAPKKPSVPFPTEPSIAGTLASQAVELRKLGLTNQAIATRLGVSITQVAPWTYGVPKHAIAKPAIKPAEVVSAGDTVAIVERPERYYPAIPSSAQVASFIDQCGIDAAQERWHDIDRDRLLSMWRTVTTMQALDKADAEAAVEKPSLWVRLLRFIGLR